ncbi:hypothetical protein Syun_003506 [Stephania yunnanensis]|uniref:Uncharacterized protein n=1 Tax=Stephania yunnanensis TaxID=152371 RepID=A0AAP0L3C8_9MAGN
MSPVPLLVVSSPQPRHLPVRLLLLAVCTVASSAFAIARPAGLPSVGTAVNGLAIYPPLLESRSSSRNTTCASLGQCRRSSSPSLPSTTYPCLPLISDRSATDVSDILDLSLIVATRKGFTTKPSSSRTPLSANPNSKPPPSNIPATAQASPPPPSSTVIIDVDHDSPTLSFLCNARRSRLAALARDCRPAPLPLRVLLLQRRCRARSSPPASLFGPHFAAACSV